jgi:starvation-inducible DNA-binding protein
MPRTSASPVVAHLLREQANATLLYLQYKGYHWNVAGPQFLELHRLFDENATKILETVDELAERQRILGAAAIYGVEDLSAVSSLSPETGLPRSIREMLDRLVAAHRTIVHGLQEGYRSADMHGDPASADLFARTLQLHEKMEWFLRELYQGEPAGYPESTGLRVAVERGGLGRSPSVDVPIPAPGHHPAG